VKHARHRRFIVRAPDPLEVDLDAGVQSAIRRLHDSVKDRFALDLEAFLDALVVAADAPWGPRVEADLAEAHVLSWTGVRALRAAGMDVGSHTRTHRVLDTLLAEDLVRELEGSRAELEAELDEPVVALAYPTGRPVAQNTPVRAAVRSAGYRLAFSYNTGRQHLPIIDPLAVCRFSVDRDVSERTLMARVVMPRLLR
jgi:hypothetical protein